jgi:hypothetical protein
MHKTRFRPPKRSTPERRVALLGEAATDVADIVVQPRGFVDHDHAGMRSRAVGEGQVRILESLGPHHCSLVRMRRVDKAPVSSTRETTSDLQRGSHPPSSGFGPRA